MPVTGMGTARRRLVGATEQQQVRYLNLYHCLWPVRPAFGTIEQMNKLRIVVTSFDHHVVLSPPTKAAIELTVIGS